MNNCCILCNDKRIVCSGYTRGKIKPYLQNGCGFLIRCPICVSKLGASKDLQAYKRFEHEDSDESRKLLFNQIVEAKVDVVLKYMFIHKFGEYFDRQDNEILKFLIKGAKNELKRRESLTSREKRRRWWRLHKNEKHRSKI